MKQDKYRQGDWTFSGELKLCVLWLLEWIDMAHCKRMEASSDPLGGCFLGGQPWGELPGLSFHDCRVLLRGLSCGKSRERKLNKVARVQSLAWNTHSAHGHLPFLPERLQHMEGLLSLGSKYRTEFQLDSWVLAVIFVCCLILPIYFLWNAIEICMFYKYFNLRIAFNSWGDLRFCRFKNLAGINSIGSLSFLC